MLAQNIARMYSQNIQETYGEYYLRQLQTGKTPLSQAAHNRNKMVLIGFVSSEIDSLTTSEAGQAILSGMSQQMRTEAIGFAKNLAFGTIIRCAAAYIAGAVAPEFLATGYAGMALFSLYQNGGAVLHTGAELVDALHQKEYAQIGSKCVGLTLCITSLGASAKNTIIHCKNAPELYAALAKHFKTDRLALAGIPQANLAVSRNSQSNSKSSNNPAKQKILPQAYIPSKINGVYKDAKYHHPNSKGSVKSPCPKNGQQALDTSIAVQNKGGAPMEGKRRIAACEGEFVVLDRQRPGEYHGHVRKWEDLEDIMQKTLKQNGLVDKNGKIL